LLLKILKFFLRFRRLFEGHWPVKKHSLIAARGMNERRVPPIPQKRAHIFRHPRRDLNTAPCAQKNTVISGN
jgi:hypothetical protein